MRCLRRLLPCGLTLFAFALALAPAAADTASNLASAQRNAEARAERKGAEDGSGSRSGTGTGTPPRSSLKSIGAAPGRRDVGPSAKPRKQPGANQRERVHQALSAVPKDVKPAQEGVSARINGQGGQKLPLTDLPLVSGSSVAQANSKGASEKAETAANNSNDRSENAGAESVPVAVPGPGANREDHSSASPASASASPASTPAHKVMDIRPRREFPRGNSATAGQAAAVTVGRVAVGVQPQAKESTAAGHAGDGAASGAVVLESAPTKGSTGRGSNAGAAVAEGGNAAETGTDAGVGEVTSAVGVTAGSSEGPGKGNPCSGSRRADMRHFFKGVVLIIHFSTGRVASSTAAFWRGIYGRLFDDIVLISDAAMPELSVEARSPERWLKDKHMAYLGLPKVMARYRQAEGFLWTSDDVVVNYWNFLGANKTKLWLPSTRNLDSLWFPTAAAAERNGTAEHAALSQDWAASDASRVHIRRALDRMDRVYRRQYTANIRPRSNAYMKQACELFFVPRRHVEALSFDLLPIFHNADVPLELALPAMFHALDHPKYWDHVLDRMVYVQEGTEGSEGVQPHALGLHPGLGAGGMRRRRESWSSGIPAFHPWRVTSPGSRPRLLKALGKGDPCLALESPASASAQLAHAL